MKSLYYCRSLSIQRADTVSDMPKSALLSPMMSAANDMAPLPLVARTASVTNYEECLACQ
jgi:ribonucleoside-diphosphate reductase alpha chain